MTLTLEKEVMQSRTELAQARALIAKLLPKAAPAQTSSVISCQITVLGPGKPAEVQISLPG
jgi:hypothetical protein